MPNIVILLSTDFAILNTFHTKNKLEALCLVTYNIFPVILACQQICLFRDHCMYKLMCLSTTLT